MKHLNTGESYEYQADRTMPTASLIKFPVMVAAYDAVEKGKLSLDERIELKPDDKVQGSGILTEHFSPGATISLRDAIQLMIVFSDNTATNLVLDKLGLPATNEYMASLGCPETRIHAKVFRADTSIAPERSKQFGLGSTTARDMVKLCELLYGDKLVSNDASEEDARAPVRLRRQAKSAALAARRHARRPQNRLGFANAHRRRDHGNPRRPDRLLHPHDQ